MTTLQAPRDPLHQLSAIRLLATSLYDSTLRSSTLSQAQNELSLLIAVLGVTKTSSTLWCTDFSRPALVTLQSCYAGLLDLERLQQSPREAEPQHQISDLCARFSSLIFELGVMNADMTM